MFKKIIKKVWLITAWFPHFSAGLLIMHLQLAIFNFPPQNYHYLISAIASILPDSDAFWQLLVKRKFDSTHKFKSFLHYPLAMCLLPLLFLPFSPFWAINISLNQFFHFVIDSMQSGRLGTGIQWLAPFVDTHFRFFSPRILTTEEVKKFILDEEEWREKILLNFKRVDTWINLLILPLILIFIFIS